MPKALPAVLMVTKGESGGVHLITLVMRGACFVVFTCFGGIGNLIRDKESEMIAAYFEKFMYACSGRDLKSLL